MCVILVIIHIPNRYFVIVFMIENIVWKCTNVLWQVTFGSRMSLNKNSTTLPFNRPFDIQIYLLDIVDYEYIPNAIGHRFKSRRCQKWNFSSFRIVTKNQHGGRDPRDQRCKRHWKCHPQLFYVVWTNQGLPKKTESRFEISTRYNGLLRSDTTRHWGKVLAIRS